LCEDDIVVVVVAFAHSRAHPTRLLYTCFLY